MTNEIVKIDLKDEQALSTILADKDALKLIKAELQKTVEFSKSLEIKDYSNDTQFKVVKDAKQGYVKTRNTIKRVFKLKRDEYNQLAKDNLEAEREVIGVIQEEEDRLDSMVKEANRLKLVEENKLKLQSRKDQLKEYECELSDDELLEMKDQEFFAKLQDAREIYLERKQKELEAEQERQRIEKEKKEAADNARKEAEAKAEQEKQAIIEAEKAKAEKAKQEAEAEKQRIIAEQKAKDDARKAAEDAEITRIANEQKAKKEEEEKLAKKKKYQKWLTDNNFDEKDYILNRTENSVIMYKKVSEFQL